MINPEIHICLLDDDQDTLDLIVKEFETLLKVVPEAILKTYTSVSAFFNDFNENVFVALVDHTLAGYSGYEVVTRINEHNRDNPSTPCCIVIMSGTSDPKVPAHYMNTRTARFFAHKTNDPDFFERLATFTRIAFNESLAEREKAEWTEAYSKRISERQAFIKSKFVSLSEETKDGVR